MKNEYYIPHAQLLEKAANREGFNVLSMKPVGEHPEFGEMIYVEIESIALRIRFKTSVLSGRNYFHILSVHNRLTGRTYMASRYHIRYVSTVNEICGNTFIALQGVIK